MWKTLQKKLQSTDSVISLLLGLAVVMVIGSLLFNYVRTRRPGTVKKSEEAAKTETQQPTGLPTTHTVKEDETLWSIAETYYKSGYNWVDVQKANSLSNPDWIEVGQNLTIPMATPIFPPGQVSSTGTVSTAEKKSYTVVSGDTLWDIAAKTYSDPYRWPEVAQANTLANPDLIHSGNVIVLP